MTPQRLLDLWQIGDESSDVLLGSFRVPAAGPRQGDRIPLLGDRFVARANVEETCVATSAASPDVLWAWLTQVMRGGGVYGWSRLDRSESQSSPHLIEGIPPPAIGDRIDRLLEVCSLEEGAEIVWRSPSPLAFLEATLNELSLDFRVEPRHPAGSCVRARMRCVIEGPTRHVGRHAAQTLCYILPRSQVRSIAERASALLGQRHAPIHFSGGETPFQHARFIPASNDGEA